MAFSFRCGQRLFPRCMLALAAWIVFAPRFFPLGAGEIPGTGEGESRPKARAFLQMPERADGVLPRLLSDTGAFVDTRTLAPAAALIPYDLIVPFWSDGAAKTRWISVPDGQKIKFAPTGEWIFPRGTVFVKTFTLATNELKPDSHRRLETRLLVCDAEGGVYGATYKWRAGHRAERHLALDFIHAREHDRGFQDADAGAQHD